MQICGLCLTNKMHNLQPKNEKKKICIIDFGYCFNGYEFRMPNFPHGDLALCTKWYSQHSHVSIVVHSNDLKNVHHIYSSTRKKRKQTIFVYKYLIESKHHQCSTYM